MAPDVWSWCGLDPDCIEGRGEEAETGENAPRCSTPSWPEDQNEEGMSSIRRTVATKQSVGTQTISRLRLLVSSLYKDRNFKISILKVFKKTTGGKIYMVIKNNNKEKVWTNAVWLSEKITSWAKKRVIEADLRNHTDSGAKMESEWWVEDRQWETAQSTAAPRPGTLSFHLAKTKI